jgi:hypothetical protein
MTIKFGPAVSQKELEKLLASDFKTEGKYNADGFKKMKARIEMIGDFEDLKKIRDIIASLAQKG